jgi:hypothetical protein
MYAAETLAVLENVCFCRKGFVNPEVTTDKNKSRKTASNVSTYCVCCCVQ